MGRWYVGMAAVALLISSAGCEEDATGPVASSYGVQAPDTVVAPDAQAGGDGSMPPGAADVAPSVQDAAGDAQDVAAPPEDAATPADAGASDGAGSACSGGACDVAPADTAGSTDSSTPNGCGDAGCDAGACPGGSCEDAVYASPPSTVACEPGELSASLRQEALAYLNEIRALSGLPPVAYDHGSDPGVQQAALIIAANVSLEHQPDPSSVCWTEEGGATSQASNLWVRYDLNEFPPDPPSVVINGWLTDIWVDDVGHRRWMLDPFLSSIAYGSVHGLAQVTVEYPWIQGAVMRILQPEDADISGLDLDFVAYPVGDYPTELVLKDWYLSFMVLASTESRWDNANVSWDGVEVAVADPAGEQLNVHSVVGSVDGVGLPNHLRFKVDGLADGVWYDVTVSGVVVDGETVSYSYSFRLK